jgi:hypothetical protein
MRRRFKDGPDHAMVAPGIGDKVMHASLRLGETTMSVRRPVRRTAGPRPARGGKSRGSADQPFRAPLPSLWARATAASGVSTRKAMVSTR